MTKSLSDWTNKNVEILFSRPRVEKIYRNLGFLKVSGGYFRRKSGESGDPTIRRVGKFAPRPEAIVRNVIGLPSAHLAAGRRSPIVRLSKCLSLRLQIVPKFPSCQKSEHSDRRGVIISWRRLSEISTVCPPPISRLVGAPRLSVCGNA